MVALTGSQEHAAERLLDLVGPLRLRYCPLAPTPRQEAFLRLRALEVLFGGAAGGGKSIALLMAAAQYLDVPGYDALLLRVALPEFELPGGLIELSHAWFANTKAAWSGEQRAWRFPGTTHSGADGASLHFGYLDGLKDAGRYAGSSFSFAGFDELSRFPEQTYRRMFRVLRQPGDAAPLAAARDGTSLSDVPVRMRATSNPSHGWIKSYFVDPLTRAEGAVFLPSRLRDNPYLNHDDYAAKLAHLPPSERERLLNGDWEIPDEGELFQRSWFEEIDRREVPDKTRAVRYWDLAATEPGPANPDPDYTVGLRLEIDDRTGSFYITGITRTRNGPGEIEEIVRATAAADGHDVRIRIEQEPGAAGRALIERYTRHVLRGYATGRTLPTGPKQIRAQVVAAAAQNGFIKLVRSPHSIDFLDEVAAFPHAPHDDCVDALAGAHHALTRNTGHVHVSVPTGSIYDQRTRTRPRRPPRSVHEAAQRLREERDETARLAARIGIPYYGG
jgi:predicted phage terminase large subunit-like protein